MYKNSNCSRYRNVSPRFIFNGWQIAGSITIRCLPCLQSGTGPNTEAVVSHGLVSRHVGLQLHGGRARGGSPHDEARAAADEARRSVASVPAGAARAAGLGLHGRVDRLQQRLVLVGVLLGELY